MCLIIIIFSNFFILIFKKFSKNSQNKFRKIIFSNFLKITKKNSEVKQLERLTIDDTEIESMLIHCKNITHLNLAYSFPNPQLPQLLLKIADEYNTQLEYLNIRFRIFPFLKFSKK